MNLNLGQPQQSKPSQRHRSKVGLPWWFGNGTTPFRIVEGGPQPMKILPSVPERHDDRPGILTRRGHQGARTLRRAPFGVIGGRLATHGGCGQGAQSQGPIAKMAGDGETTPEWKLGRGQERVISEPAQAIDNAARPHRNSLHDLWSAVLELERHLIDTAQDKWSEDHHLSRSE
jgi:hypothetical protein